MPSNRTRSPARILAPMALLAIVLAVALVVLGSGDSDDKGAGEATTTAGNRPASGKSAGNGGRDREPTVYTVKPGDTLGAIGQKTGVEVEKLQELNPSLDPQALVSGQKIKLRE